MVAQVMAEGLDRFIVLAQIFIVLPNQLAPLEEQTRSARRWVSLWNRSANAARIPAPRARREILHRRRQGQAILEACPEMDQQLPPHWGSASAWMTPHRRPQPQRYQEQRREQAVEAVSALHPDYGKHSGGQQAEQSRVLRHSSQRRSCRRAAQQCGNAVKGCHAPQRPAQTPAAPLPQKDQQGGQAQGPAQGVQVRPGIWEVMAEKADAAQRGQHQGKDGQRGEGRSGVPPPPEALQQKGGGEQESKDETEGRGDGGLEALRDEAALIGVSAAQFYPAGVSTVGSISGSCFSPRPVDWAMVRVLPQ